MEKKEMIYEGKAKQVFATDQPDKVIIHYKDAATAGNGAKKADIDNKGVLNNKITTVIFNRLKAAGIPTHHTAGFPNALIPSFTVSEIFDEKYHIGLTITIHSYHFDEYGCSDPKTVLP